MLLLVLTAVVMLSSISYAQSDYEKTQNFKTKFKQLEESIKKAGSLEEVEKIAAEIEKFKSEFAADKALLDKSLYPDNFNTSIEKLARAAEVRKGDFTQIVELTTQVVSLKDQVSELNQINTNLISQIKTLKLSAKKDAETIASLQKLVATLKENIRERDELVRGIVDSLLAEFVNHPFNLNDAERQAISQKVDTGNLFFNIERTISDNLQFLKVTALTPDDLSEMKKEYKDFSKAWHQIGPRLGDVYLSKSEKTAQIANIDNMFDQWGQILNNDIWTSVNKEFKTHQINLLAFRTGEQFTISITNFIDDEIKNLGVKRKEESENIFHTFTDSVWFKTVEPTWVPMLIENNMMTQANKDSIESKIAQWQDIVVEAAGFNWVYAVLGVAIVALLIALFVKGRKKPQSPPEEKSE